MTEGRMSIKFKVSYQGVGLHDYVFATDADDAEQKARRHFELADDTEVTITRMSENAHGHLGTGRKQLSNTGFIPEFHPAHATQTAELTTP